MHARRTRRYPPHGRYFDDCVTPLPRDVLRARRRISRFFPAWYRVRLKGKRGAFRNQSCPCIRVSGSSETIDAEAPRLYASERNTCVIPWGKYDWLRARLESRELPLFFRKQRHVTRTDWLFPTRVITTIANESSESENNDCRGCDQSGSRDFDPRILIS